MEENRLDITKEMVESLLELLKTEANVEVSEDPTNSAVQVQIETSDPGILIGYHGQTLSSFQMLLGILLNKRIGEWVRVIVNVGDYRQKREEVLKRIAFSAAQKAHFSGEPVILGELSSSERRTVHMILSDHPDVETYSEGEGRERILIVKPRSTSVSKK